MSNQIPVGKSVEYFMRLMGQEIPDEPTVLDEETWKLRLALIDEERKELIEAHEAGDLAAFLDAIVDLVYVAVGSAPAAGLTQFDEAFAAVHRANMDKAPECADCGGCGEILVRRLPTFGKDETEPCETCAGKGRIVQYRDDGKVLKPVGWVAPDIASIIWKETDARPAATTAE